VKPANAHTALNVITDPDGTERAHPAGQHAFAAGAEQFRTYFIGYAKDRVHRRADAANMFVGDPPGTYDRTWILDAGHRQPVFVRPDFLEDPPAPK